MSKRIPWLLALSLALLAGLALAGLAAAQEGTPVPGAVTDDEVNRVAKQLFCPVCENIPLDVCPTQACKQWRATIRDKIGEGWNDQQIMDYFVEQYGERVLAEPSTRGLNVLVWVIPPVLVAAGGVFLWRILRRLAPAQQAAAPPAPAADDPNNDYVKRLEQELARRR